MDPLTLLLIPLAVAGVFGLCVLFWGLRPPTLPDRAAVLARLSLEKPGIRPGREAWDLEARAALIADEASDRIVLIRAFGDGMVITVIGPGSGLRATLSPSGQGLHLHSTDLTQPAFDLRLGDSQTAAYFAERLSY